MKRLAIVVVAVSALALTAGALAATAPSGKYRTKITSGDLKGTWTLNFVTRGSYTVKGPFPGLINGKRTVSGSTMTFNHERNSQDETCGDVLGRYRFAISGKTLTLTRISDSCAPRRSVFSHKLTKVE